MTKSELIKITAKQANVTQQQAGEIISAALEVAADALASGDSVSIQRFGVLEVRERKQRVTHNLQTGEQITINAHKGVAFKPFEELKNRINN